MLKKQLYYTDLQIVHRAVYHASDGSKLFASNIDRGFSFLPQDAIIFPEKDPLGGAP